ncbi:MAG TPA: hypothetical protein VFS20_22570, partial [Longimicrobium sp.]|nr:hypothetical protein [Longimicrobium sp.]
LGIPLGGSANDAPDTSPADASSAGAAPPDAAPAEPGPGVRLFADLVGEAPERVTDPEVFIQSLRRLGDQAVDLARQATGGEEGKAAARARLHALADTLRAHGLAVPQPLAPPAPPRSPELSDDGR